MQGQTIRKKVIENGRKRNDTHTSVDRADSVSYTHLDVYKRQTSKREM